SAIGHNTNKIDLIIMGGTFTARNPDYQDWFVKRCFDAFNETDSENLREAKKTNELANHRCIGLTVETRPDWFRLQHVDRSLELGATRVELGVQTTFDNILYNIKRGHTVTDSILATRIAKDSGFKVCYHMMPGLPDSNYDKDIEAFKTIFEYPDFKPDMIKIYPTLTIKGTKLYDMWKKGDYEPLSTKKAAELISEIKEYVPEWVRIQRVQRDVPSPYIDAGVDKSNLRQFVEKELIKHHRKCRCIRCREIGHKSLRENIEINEDNISMDVTNYDASASSEIFISLVEKSCDGLIGFLRLRDIENSHRLELSKNPCMIIRELKVVGKQLPMGEKDEKGFQHKGFGKELIKEAERICYEEFDKRNLFVISGIGVKEYYRKLNFKDDGVYLCKKLLQ
ncbi:MAG: tRNA uridine(34) 5-carboxymethylaminomethyl modification radical SAM/GNAT enzyme Elp3, partial [Candidatus Thermoplasmatota archaeon]|nr:tRNA uridine(34) 5-carboxymethylaminomethyl modification radical SAM/GNAT enzyme Elp3 [Candidatus Thermoplasmatota archaeon]